MLKCKPIISKDKEEVTVEVKGYGCDDDCTEYFTNTVSQFCGYRATCKDTCWW